MASPLHIAQQVLSQGLQKSTKNEPSYQCINGTPVLVTTNSSSTNSMTNDNAPNAQFSPPEFQYFPSLINFFFSSMALMEWFKILIYGSLLEMLRRLIYNVFRQIYNSFFITATFEEKDVSYSWVCFWLSRQPTWRSAREIEVSTGAFGFISSMIEGETNDTIHSGARQVAYLPADNTIHTMWYKNHWMRITRYTSEGKFGTQVRHLRICLMARSRTVLNDLLIQAKKEYNIAQSNITCVAIPDQTNHWQIIATLPKRSPNSIILDPGMKETLIEDAKNFLDSKAWYAARGIPFRRGYLLYGPPGSGKTSIINSIAGELGMDLNLITLSKSGMDDTSLNQLISSLPNKCIALMEDIDAAFSQTLNREPNDPSTSQNTKDDEDDEDDEDEDEDDTTNSNSRRPQTTTTTTTSTSFNRSASRITLSGLLNALDGVGAQGGRILFATTNKYHSLDPALCRPGRVDVHMEFKNASRYQARELFKCFYMPESPDEVFVSEDTADADAEGEGESEPKGEKEQDVESTSDRPKQRGGKLLLAPSQVEKLAQEFADAIQEREFSMASLQGYLLRHKVTPVAAVKKVAAWVTQERELESERKRHQRP